MQLSEILGCFAASDSFVLDGLVNETNLHLDMENMIAAAQRTLLQLVTQWQEIRSCRECKTPACDGREDSKARFWCMQCWKNEATVGRIGTAGLQISVFRSQSPTRHETCWIATGLTLNVLCQDHDESCEDHDDLVDVCEEVV